VTRSCQCLCAFFVRRRQPEEKRAQRTNCQPRSSTTRKTRDIFDTFDGRECHSCASRVAKDDLMLKLTLQRVRASVRMRAIDTTLHQPKSPGNATSTLEGPLRHASTSQTAAAKGTSALQLQVLLCHVTCDPVTYNASAKICGLPIYHLSAITCHLSSVICHLSSVICHVICHPSSVCAKSVICHLSSAICHL
jgi:hypothetical protein